MRFRPFGRSGTVVSAVTLEVSESAAQKFGTELVFTALECGINAFETSAADLVAQQVVGEALAEVERRLVFVSVRAGVHRGETAYTRDFSPQAMASTVDACRARLGLGPLDLLVLDEPAEDEVPAASIAVLKSARAEGRVHLLGVAGGGDEVDGYLATGAFDVLAAPFNLASGWKERHRIKSACGSETVVVGYDFHPHQFRAEEARGLLAPLKSGLFRRKPPKSNPLQGMGTYAFLESTRNWTAQEICLAYALTEPGLATVRIAPESLEELEGLAAVVDREMPTGLAAQIEMARFSPETARSA